MTKEQEEAIEIIDKMIKSYIEADECGLSNNDFKHEIRAMQTVLSLIKQQEEKIAKYEKIYKEYDCYRWVKEIDKKDKIIDLMADFIFQNIDVEEDICNSAYIKCKQETGQDITCINCIKQYFERKVEEK